MALDEATVRRVARLARIYIPDAEFGRLVDELNQIIGWVERLGEVDTAAAAPMTSVAEMTLKMRDDAVTDGGDPAAVTGNAPDAEGGFYRVQKVVE